MNRYAVVTPYYTEDEASLRRCIDSVKSQTLAADHILVADGRPQDWLDAEGVRHLRLDRNHADFGNTPRVLGAILATASAYDALCFLDADNWFDATHLEHCIAQARTAKPPVDVVFGKRRFVRSDGTVMPLIDPGDFVDTSCYLIMRSGFHLLPIWGLVPPEVALIGDRIFWQHIQAQVRKSQIRVTRAERITVNYRSLWASSYLAIGETPPVDAKPDIDSTPVYRWWRALDQERRTWYGRVLGFSLDRLFEPEMAQHGAKTRLRRSRPFR